MIPLRKSYIRHYKPGGAVLPAGADVRDLQTTLYEGGYYGETADETKIIDGIWGPSTQKALQKALDDGYVWKKGVLQSPGFFANITNTLSDLLRSLQSKKGRAVYLHYPNFNGSAANALKIGGVDVGKNVAEAFGIDINAIPVGHGEVLFIHPDNAVQGVRYGRYTTGTGHIRKTVKGGNWGIYKYPSMKPDESVEQYLRRIQGRLAPGSNHIMIEDGKYGPYEAIEIPDVDTKAAVEYALSQANDPSRPEYSIFNTCATGAVDAVEAGLGPWDKFIIHSFPRHFDFSDADASMKQTLWGLIPGTTNQYAKQLRHLGKSVIIK